MQDFVFSEEGAPKLASARHRRFSPWASTSPPVFHPAAAAGPSPSLSATHLSRPSEPSWRGATGNCRGRPGAAGPQRAALAASGAEGSGEGRRHRPPPRAPQAAAAPRSVPGAPRPGWEEREGSRRGCGDCYFPCRFLAAGCELSSPLGVVAEREKRQRAVGSRAPGQQMRNDFQKESIQ
ncbi:uncharacterized protein V3H86_004994 [Mergus octosetaceus]